MSIRKGVLDRTAAATIAQRLFSNATCESMAFWADGGQESGPYSPGAHYLSAYPEIVARTRVDALPFRGLVSWLRERLPSENGEPGYLTAVGLSYDAGRNLEHIPAKSLESPRLPDIVIARYPAYLSAPTHMGPWALHGASAAAMDRLMATASRVLPPGDGNTHRLPHTLSSEIQWDRYEEGIQEVLENVAAGNLYQANISRRLSAPMKGELTPSLYGRLRAINPSAFGALWRMDEDLWLASSSPECLLQWEASKRLAHSYPIKGTRPRGSNEDEDRALAEALMSSVKDRAEHVMIVDLVRNDLGRIAEPGSVSVPSLFSLMRLPSVFHLVSDVQARARADVDLADIIATLFPGGSITGAPKIAAMSQIEKVERHRRGFYTGSLGVITEDGDATFSILIRTCVATAGKVFYQTGGGIVADSHADEEWRETEVKAHSVMETLRMSRTQRDAPE